MIDFYEGHFIQSQVTTFVFVAIVFVFVLFLVGWFQFIILDPCLLSSTLFPYSQFHFFSESILHYYILYLL